MAKTMTKPQAKKAKKKIAKRPVAPRTESRLPRHRQYGVIPVRFSRDGQIQVLLVTSRGTGRWLIPKGWPMRKRTPAGTAEREAFEEAGVKGWFWSRKPIGSYRYLKQDESFTGEILVRVFVLVVEQQKKNWPEKEERRVRWYDLRKAAALVKERDLAKLLRDLPRLLVGEKLVRPARKKK
jgi:8-oxo-dGTP pyrophosphatase MutT (NUDIX family)